MSDGTQKSYDFERPKTRICAKCYHEGSWFYCRDCIREGDIEEAE